MQRATIAMLKKNVLKAVDLKPRRGIKCVNHKKIQAVAYCEVCNDPLCDECLIINYRSNFINAAFAGSKDQFVKDMVCAKCSKQINKSQICLSIVILCFFLFFVFILIIGA